jgi:hypothetical protein
VHSKVWPRLIAPHIHNHYKWHHIIKRSTPFEVLIIRFLWMANHSSPFNQCYHLLKKFTYSIVVCLSIFSHLHNRGQPKNFVQNFTQMWMRKTFGATTLTKAFHLEIFGKFCQTDKVLGLGLPNSEHLLPSYKSPNSKRITKENLVSYLLCNQIWLDPPLLPMWLHHKSFLKTLA